MIHVRGQTRQNLKQKETLQFRQPDKLLSNAVSAPVKGCYLSSLGNVVDFTDMSVSPNILAKR